VILVKIKVLPTYLNIDGDPVGSHTLTPPIHKPLTRFSCTFFFSEFHTTPSLKHRSSQHTQYTSRCLVDPVLVPRERTPLMTPSCQISSPTSPTRLSDSDTDYKSPLSFRSSVKSVNTTSPTPKPTNYLIVSQQTSLQRHPLRTTLILISFSSSGLLLVVNTIFPYFIITCDIK
jgi:hypothetical protein